jgi:hypothetical protein
VASADADAPDGFALYQYAERQFCSSYGFF